MWKAKTDPNSEAVKTYILDNLNSMSCREKGFRNPLRLVCRNSRTTFASRNLLLAEMKMALTTKDVNVDFPSPDFDNFQREFDDYIASKVQAGKVLRRSPMRL